MTTTIEQIEQHVEQTREKRADMFFKLGLAYAAGQGVDQDDVTAHKWFNLAAMCGLTEAISHRRELAEVMSEDQIIKALRDAREWLKI